MIPLFKNISALLNAHKYRELSKGLRIQVPGGDEHIINITRTEKVVYQPGLRFSEYAFRSVAESSGVIEVGYGEDDSKLLAYEKSISEAVERLLFRLCKNIGVGTETSSGWAAHLTKELAQKAAFEELAERDAVMVHWLRKIPMIEIDPETFPPAIRNWVSEELVLHKDLKCLRLLLSTEGYCPTVTAILETGMGDSIASHGTASSLFAAYKKAMVEGCRLASNLELRQFFESSKSLSDENTLAKINAGDHGMFYAFHQTLPSWLFGEKVTWSKAEFSWKQALVQNKDRSKDFNFIEIVKSPLSIGYAEAPTLQKLYFGTTKAAIDAGRINFSRLNIGRGSKDLNMMPHFIS